MGYAGLRFMWSCGFHHSFLFKDTKYAPAKVVPLSNIKLRIESDMAQDFDDAFKRLSCLGSSRVTVQMARKLQPMLILKGIAIDTPGDKLEKIIIEQIQN